MHPLCGIIISEEHKKHKQKKEVHKNEKEF